jgi:hypothetical protein
MPARDIAVVAAAKQRILDRLNMRDALSLLICLKSPGCPAMLGEAIQSSKLPRQCPSPAQGWYEQGTFWI